MIRPKNSLILKAHFEKFATDAKYTDLAKYAQKADSFPYFYTTHVLYTEKTLTGPALIRFPGGLAGSMRVLIVPNRQTLENQNNLNKEPGVNAAFDLQKVFLNTLSPRRYADVFVKAFELGYELKNYRP